MATDVTIPALGESITEATVGEWLKAPGDAVAADEPIVSLETDKVAVEVPSPVAGTMGEQLFKVGDTVNVGALIARIESGAGAPAQMAAPTPAVVENVKAAAAKAEPSKAETPKPETKADAPAPTAEPLPSKTAPAEPALAPTPASHDELEAIAPAVRRLLGDYNLDPASITGTGLDGRLTKGDVLAAIEAGTAKVIGKPAAAAPAGPAAAPERKEERVRMTRLRQTIARRLKEAQNTAAMLTTFNDVDMTAVMAARTKYKDLFEKKHGVRLGFMSFFAKAVVLALRDIPSVNAAIEGDEIVYRDYADLGIAVSSPGGLVVPVLKDANKHSFADIEKAIGDFGRRARDGKLTMADMQGGTFTITNGGVFGSLMSTPILNTPQSGVLGMHRIEDRPVVRDGQIVIRPMMYLALSYDHRLVDGREAVTFLVAVKDAIEDPARLLIDL
ncbi:2-oxoglutarate dehydrogenase complex dihydrolipoyllysine-residue succinyltransferase [Polymorphobacter sp. PAMC 29334]|uniref:2-oxoglutarate dehydrogenase complex dihydrolipoyllysine-residue succinyltransferase n=1 Tax=Polymorphobacter sp. PAMC 29334 TaxID=2862331 RepID=UPI001C743C05|nr:2-oxoglutarate dehydrogenase complex dihydrolipoyllysine-residue succinyltransferase [Polymorphobacter sp. PAMC 29334]QYE34484.1 2-oxoglutarate dehydrogenase complex dihydrolipoyllysine-residue succinyltransferase [Polymorphobacter sp. PAMC 29334]